MEGSPDAARRWYAEDLRIAAPVVHNEAIIEAFARVPRERFSGAPPWRIRPRRLREAPVTLPDLRPTALYHDVLIVIDEARGINIGQPSLWAYIFDQLHLGPGQRVLQIGAGTGYYTALLAEIVGPQGRVTGIELEVDLAERAQESLKPWPWATVRQGNGVEMDAPAADVIVVCAGATHPARAWLDNLTQGGRLMVPLTAAAGWGFLLLAEKKAAGIAAATLGSCGYVPCEGARRPLEAQRLQMALAPLDGKPVPIRSLHVGKPPAGTTGVWFEGEDYWLSTEPLEAPSA